MLWVASWRSANLPFARADLPKRRFLALAFPRALALWASPLLQSPLLGSLRQDVVPRSLTSFSFVPAVPFIFPPLPTISATFETRLDHLSAAARLTSTSPASIIPPRIGYLEAETSTLGQAGPYQSPDARQQRRCSPRKSRSQGQTILASASGDTGQ